MSQGIRLLANFIYRLISSSFETWRLRNDIPKDTPPSSSRSSKSEPSGPVTEHQTQTNDAY